jgi:hypothetical protein
MDESKCGENGMTAKKNVRFCGYVIYTSRMKCLNFKLNKTAKQPCGL